MDEVIELFVIAAVGAIIANLLVQFGQHDPNAKGGIFQRIQAVWSWAINNAYGNN